MRNFSLVSPRLWNSQRFIGLPSDNARLLYLYLLTCRHQTSIGAYHLPDAYACADLGWDLERYLSSREELVRADLIAFDPEVGVIAVRRWFKHNPISNEKHRMGALRLIRELESQSIADVVMSDYETAMRTQDVARPHAVGPATAIGVPRPASVAALDGPYAVKRRIGT
jgi:hypothetical protein